MKLVPCGNGHFYDPSLHSVCPCCTDSQNLEACPQCHAVFDRAKYARCPYCTVLCPDCGNFYYRTGSAGCPYCAEDHAAMQHFAQYGLPRILYAKTDCSVYTLNGGYVLKKLTGSQLDSGKKEADILRNFQNKAHTVELAETRETRNSVYILESYSVPLPEYIRSREIHWQQIRQLAVDLCDDLLYLYEKGYYHLDVHPKNIYINADGHAVLGDFGNAQPVQAARVENLEAVAPRYIYPAYFEIDHSMLQISEAWDLHSLCMVLYGLLNDGKLPWNTESPEAAAGRLFEAEISGKKDLIQFADNDALSLLVKDVLCGDMREMRVFRDRLDQIDPAKLPLKKPARGRRFGHKQKSSSNSPDLSRVYQYPLSEECFDADKNFYSAPETDPQPASEPYASVMQPFTAGNMIMPGDAAAAFDSASFSRTIPIDAFDSDSVAGTVVLPRPQHTNI